MKSVIVNARAKINLTLDVLGKRNDGFHSVEMIMQSVELHDKVTLEETEQGIEAVTDHPLLLKSESNIAYKAARLLIDKLGIGKGVKISISKNIPVAAGLAGGSTDAAAVLKGLNKLWNLRLSQNQLAEYGSVIGSDVPFCIQGGAALATGRGEKILSLPDVQQIWMVLAKPPLEVSTAEVYNNFKPECVTAKPNTQAVIDAIQSGDEAGIRQGIVNALESVTLARYPQVSELKLFMADQGIKLPLMSGSGPTVFGFVDSQAEAEKIAGCLKEGRPELFVTVTRTWPSGLQEFDTGE
ncbi:MAG TPA: 4-(cytidine 5'-diphospho)-2-C-methyl-D-erythritol kinase [Desulfobacteria bacterium]|nr:4-(cytidine 5'-diphospho)-2-C-methyl-D-erythritol kinase [Desulfobacteria bacterium]